MTDIAVKEYFSSLFRLDLRGAPDYVVYALAYCLILDSCCICPTTVECF